LDIFDRVDGPIMDVKELYLDTQVKASNLTLQQKNELRQFLNQKESWTTKEVKSLFQKNLM
jgi:transposase